MQDNCLECDQEGGWTLAKWPRYDDCTGECRRMTPAELRAAATKTDASAERTTPESWTYDPGTASQYVVPPLDGKVDPLACSDLNDASAMTMAGNAARNMSTEPPTAVMVTTVGKQKNSIQRDLQTAAAATWLAMRPDLRVIVAVDSTDSPAPLKQIPRTVCPSNPAGTPFVAGLFNHAESQYAFIPAILRCEAARQQHHKPTPFPDVKASSCVSY